MPRLLLLRHAHSDPGEDDLGRPLSERGRREARAVGALMRAKELRPGRIVASPARRTVGTAQAVVEALGALPPEEEARIYGASAEVLLDIIGSTPSTVDCLLLVGHNPGLEDLLGLMDAEVHLKPADLAEVRFEGSWDGLGTPDVMAWQIHRPLAPPP